MINRILRSLVLLLVVLISGCATPPKTAPNFDMVEIPPANDTESILVFFRIVTPPLLYDMQVQINGRKVASLPNYAFSYIAVKPGEVKVNIGWNRWSGMRSREESVDVSPNQTMYLELGSAIGGPYGTAMGVASNLIHESNQAIEELRLCCKYVPANGI